VRLPLYYDTVRPVLLGERFRRVNEKKGEKKREKNLYREPRNGSGADGYADNSAYIFPLSGSAEMFGMPAVEKGTKRAKGRRKEIFVGPALSVR